MTERDILRFRLANQLITKNKRSNPEDVASWMGAIQAQDLGQAKYAIGCRMVNAVNGDIEKAINEKSIIRTWALRGTLHILAAADVHWLLPLVAPVILARYRPQFKRLDLDDSAFTKIHHCMVQLLYGGRQLTRKALFEGLEQNKISTAGLRGTLILYKAGWLGIICLGPLKGKQDTYTLLEEWLPKTNTIPRQEALAELAKRYFQSHGPATVNDLILWSGLSITEGRLGLELIKETLAQTEVNGKQYWMTGNIQKAGTSANKSFLLPAFDEYVLGYKDRSLILDNAHTGNVMLKNGIFKPVIITNGKITGTWKKTLQKNNINVETGLFDTSITPDHFAAEIKKIIDFYRA
jgi:Winged helix DNA-binding domain